MAGLIGSHATVVSSGAERKKHYDITTTTTSLTGLQYTPTKVHVYHNGIRLVDGTDYTATNGTSITLTNAAENGDDVVVISYATFQPSDTVSATNGGTFTGDVTFNGSINGSVGIGTSSPSNTLHIKSSNPNIRLEDSDGASNIYSQVLSDGSGSLYLRADTGGNGSSSRMQFDVDGSERMRIDSSGNVLVGVSQTASSGLAIATGENLTFSEDNTTTSYANIFRQSNSGAAVLANGYKYTSTANKMASSLGSSWAKSAIGAYSGRVAFYVDNASADTIGTDLTPTERVRIDTDGLKFNGDSAAANGLNDYEEGTWTPTPGSGTWTVNDAKYVKIGGFVHCSFHVTATSTVGTADFTGLPFAPSQEAAGIVGFQNHISGEVLAVYVQAANSGLWNLRVGSTQYGLGNGKTMRGSFTYPTNS